METERPGKRRFVALVVLVATASFTFNAQTPQFRSEASLVRVDVSILDRDRQPVHGLTIGDFSISEDGKTQPIVAFSEVSLPDSRLAGPTWANEVAADVDRNDKTSDQRLVAIVLDDALMPVDGLIVNSAKDIARKLIGQLAPGDLAAVVFTADSRRAQGFTEDRAKLLAAVDALSPGLHVLGNLFSPDKMVVNMEKARALSVTSTLRLLVDALTTIPDRRKALILISAGAPVDVDSAARSDPSDPTPQAYMAMKDIVSHAQRANVNIYAVDPAGLDGLRILLQRQVPVSRFEVEQREFTERVEILSRSYRDFNRVFADNTGGKAFFNTNEFDTGVAQILRETGSFYLLGYRSTNVKEDGRFRRIQVSVKGKGYLVNARRGYYAPDPPRSGAKLTEPPPGMAQAIGGLLPKADLPMRATATPFAVSGGRDAIVVFAIGLRVPTGTVRPATDAIQLSINAFTNEGQARGSEKLTASVTLGATDVSQDVDYEVLGSLKLSPGRYQVRLSAESGLAQHAGSVYQDVEVPDFRSAPITLSGLIISANPQVPSAPRDKLPVPVVPTTRRTFGRDDSVTAFLRIYQGGTGPMRPASVRAQILDSLGAVVFDLPRTVGSDEFDLERQADYLVQLPIDRLKPGLHLLRVLATVGTTSVRRESQFVAR